MLVLSTLSVPLQVVVDTAEVEDAEEEAANQQGQGEEVLSDDPDLRMDDELRAQFPMSFGECPLHFSVDLQMADKLCAQFSMSFGGCYCSSEPDLQMDDELRAQLPMSFGGW
eukprot:1158105-Pelagomonas_calceolata.AAC.12